MNEAELEQNVRAALSEQRFRHVEGVVKTAAELARLHGEDVEWMRIAAWMHDIAREWPLEQLVQAAEDIEVPSGFALIPNLLHGPIAAAMFRDWFGPLHLDLENAIRYHTTGRIGMSRAEMILYLADATEPSRHYPGVDDIRRLARIDLVHALACSMDSTILYLVNRHEPIFPLTVMARNEIWERVHRENRVVRA